MREGRVRPCIRQGRLLAQRSLLIVAGALATSIAAQDKWPEDRASLQIAVEAVSSPSTPEAGMIAIIPDGGLLPRPVPEPAVYGPDGKSLPCELLWHNPAAGMAVVFTPPAAGRAATVYLKSAANRPTTRSGTVFYPSLLLFTRETPAASLELAQKLPGALIGSSDVLMGPAPYIGQRENIQGADDNYLSYYTGWIKRPKAGRVYFATISDEGSELKVDGKSVASWPGLHNRRDGAKGQFGGWVELTAGMHRIEYFQFEKDGEQEAQAAWRIPGETSGDLPVTIPAAGYVHSGFANPTRAIFRDGRPVAAISGNRQAINYLWFANTPVNLYRFEAAMADGNPPGTVYTWVIEGNRQSQGRTLDWLVEGGATFAITLRAAGKQGTTQVTVPVTSATTPLKAQATSLSDRVTYRNTLLAMCRAVPTDKDPCARWSPDLWATLVGVSEPFRGYDLLLEVFSRSPSINKALKPADRQFLADVLLEVMRISSPKDVPAWAKRLIEAESDPDVKLQMKHELFDYTLYDAADVAAARAQAADLAAKALTPEDDVRAQIRMGDVERAAGNMDEAVRLYSTAQDRYRDAASSSMAMKTTRMAGRPRPKDRTDGPSADRPRRADRPVVLRATSQSWKTFAVQEAAFLATARNLIRKSYLVEARGVLRKWEREAPLCKVNGEYPLAEAEYYMAAQHFARAAAGLRVYRKGVDVSSSLPEAMELELDCLCRLKQEAEARELASDIRKRFPNHPVAERARQVLEYGIR